MDLLQRPVNSILSQLIMHGTLPPACLRCRWRALEIGQLNERPELEPAGGGKHGAAGEHAAGAHASSFMPQLLPNKQKLDFGAGGGGAGASEGERI